MWYEKFNWSLYSCSGLDNPDMPVYTINYQITLGHKDFFLPTHWLSYHYVWAMNNYWLSWRMKLQESFILTHLFTLLVLGAVVFVGILSIPLIAKMVNQIYQASKNYLTSAVLKILVSLVILLIWYLSIQCVPYYFYPSTGYFYFYLFYTVLASIFIFGFNRGTNTALGMKSSCKNSLFLLFGCHFVLSFLYCTSMIENIAWIYRLGLMFVQFFVELYCLYSQLSPLQKSNKMLYTGLPE